MAYASGIARMPVGNEDAWGPWNPVNDRHFVNHMFVPQVYLHSIGQLNCCRSGGCWKVKVTEGKPEQNCSDVVRGPSRVPLPRCLDMITAEKVADEVLKYEEWLSKEDFTVPTIEDLVVKLKDTEKPPPAQTPSPVVIAAENSDPNVAGKPIPPKKLQFQHLKFPITICGLTYGDHGDLAVRCLSSIYKYLDPSLFRLRYGFNEVTKGSRKKVMKFLQKQSNVERVYEADPQVYKYPMMRQMFHDQEKPIETDWIMWFDDDSHVIDREWIRSLGQKVDENYLVQDARAPKGYHCYGKVYYWHIRGNQWQWIKEADWYGNRELLKDGSKNPPMDKSDFCTGGYWMISRQAMLDCNWPDQRIIHRGGDIMLGVALHQQGYGVMQIHNGVRISDAKQRGYNEEIAGVS